MQPKKKCVADALFLCGKKALCRPLRYVVVDCVRCCDALCRKWPLCTAVGWFMVKISNPTLQVLSPVHTVAEKCHCRRKRRLSQKSATVAENGECCRKRRENGDSRTFLRQCGQGFKSITRRIAVLSSCLLVLLYL